MFYVVVLVLCSSSENQGEKKGTLQFNIYESTHKR